MHRLATCASAAAVALLLATQAVGAWQRSDVPALPERVCLTWSSDPRTSQSVTWRTPPTTASCTVQVTEATSEPIAAPKARDVPAVTSSVTQGGQPWSYHAATMTELKPDTLYAYRVGDGKTWSAWFQFRTAAAKAEPFSFLYFGDAQHEILSGWSRVVRQAYATAPQARFMVHAGDIVDGGSDDAQWGEWFGGGGWIFAQVPSLPAAGNHEHDVPGNRLTEHWNTQFRLPTHGPGGVEGSCYYIDYQGLRVIVLNCVHHVAEQTKWLDDALAGSPGRWAVVVLHYPVPSTKELAENWMPVLARRKVDLVLQGHTHAYTRSKGGRAPVYIESVSGPATGGKAQLFHVISVGSERLRFESRTATGRLHDAFELAKRPDGSAAVVEEASAPGPR